MGWGEARRPSPATAADRLADAVRAWRDAPTTGNAEKLGAALDGYDRAKEAERARGVIHVNVSGPPPERVVVVPFPVERETGRRSGW